MAGRTTRRSLESCSVTIRPGSLTRSRRRSAPAPLLPTLADRSPTARRSEWRASAMPTSTPTGRPRTTSSPTPTRSTRCSSGSGPPTPRVIAAVRGVLHGAMALYLARYLNVPPARIPGEDGEQLDDLPADAEMIRAALLDAFDRQRQVDLAARLVARHLTLGHSPQALIATLARAVLREDAGFHAYQMLEAGVRQFTAWGDTDERPAHPHCSCPLSCGPFTDRTRGAADGRHRPALDAGRRAASGGWGVVTTRAEAGAALPLPSHPKRAGTRPDRAICPFWQTLRNRPSASRRPPPTGSRRGPCISYPL